MPPVFSLEIGTPTLTNGSPAAKSRISPCEAACPAGNPIQKIQSLIASDRFEEAVEYLRARNPFPGTTGRICSHPCEIDCNRGQYDERLNIKGIERAAADCADMTRVRKPKKMAPSGKRIAVIGGGPAGLTFAYYSALLGHDVTVFEAGPTLGGMPRMAVPEFRLPKDVMDKEIGLVLETGIRARFNTKVGVDISFDEIRKSFDAVLIAAGTWKERELDIPNSGKAIKAVDFLFKANLGQIREAGPKVAVIGGGGVAFDCAFTAKRLGAKEVFVICLEDSEGMCAPPEDLAQARLEDVAVFNSCMGSQLLVNNSRIVGLEYCEVSGFSFDEANNVHIRPSTGPKRVLDADMVIVAIGLKPELGFMEGSGIQTNPNGTVAVDPRTMSTSIPGVFAAGDVTAGPSLMANAVGMGRKAALTVNQYLTATPEDSELVIENDFSVKLNRTSPVTEPHVVAFEEIFNPEFFDKAPRLASARPDQSGLPADGGLDRPSAANEAARCFQCGRCRRCGKCVEDCPGLILAMTGTGPKVVNPDECWHCGNCRISCPDAAVSFDFPIYMLV